MTCQRRLLDPPMHGRIEIGRQRRPGLFFAEYFQQAPGRGVVGGQRTVDEY